MARVTVDNVSLIVDNDLTDEQIEQCISTANLLVDENCVGKGLSTSVLTDIERWLSAHFVKIIEPQVLSEKADVVSQWFVRKIGLGLDGTSYGQQALALDSTGSLRKLGETTYKNTAFKSINVLS